MQLSYFDAKKELKRIYQLSNQALKSKNRMSINSLLSGLKELHESMNDSNMDNFGKYLIGKEIKRLELRLKMNK